MKRIKNLLICSLLVATTVFMFPSQGNASTGYSYNSSTKTYTITQKGNITTALTNAITAAGSGSTIVIPSGSYNAGVVKMNKSNITIRATGATITYNGSTSTNPYILKGENATSGIKISGGTWNGASKSKNVFQFKSASNITVENCTVSGALKGYASMRFENGSNLTCTNITASKSDYGIYAQGVTNVKLTNAKATGNRIGFGLRSLKGSNTLSSCSVTGNTGDGLQVQDSSTKITVSGGSYSSNKNNGISLTRSAQMTLTNATVSNNTLNGISPVGTDGKVTLTAKNTVFNNNGRHGVAADSGAKATLDKCTANNNAKNGFILNKKCTSGGITNCTANGNGTKTSDSTGGCGILVQDGSTCSKVSNNTCNNNKKLGISLEDTNATVSKCTANSNAKHGFFISGSKTKTVKIQNCTSTSNKQNGLFVTGKQKVTTTNSTFTKNGNSGILTEGTSLKVDGAGNKLTYNKKYGIGCQKGKLYVVNATISNNSNYGIYFTGTSTGGYCTGAKITNNKAGIIVQKGASIAKIEKNTITGNKKYGIAVYKNSKGRKTTLSSCKNNTFCNPAASKEIQFWSGTKVPSKLKVMYPTKIDASVAKGKTKVTGTATASRTVFVTVKGKTYKAKSNKKKKYSIKTPSLPQNVTLTAYVKDSLGNKLNGTKKI